MRHRLPLIVLAVVLAATPLVLACYRDDSSGPLGGKPVVRVLLTDAPFPFDSVAAVNLYVDSIEAAATTDTGTADWVTVAAPHRTFNLLDVQQGATTLVGQGQLSVGQYQAVRMTIDVDSSSIAWNNGGTADVDWPHPGRVTLYALVQPAFTVGDVGADIVLDFDVGQSFPYNLFGNAHFAFVPWLRAVNSAETGAIEGVVSTSYTGTTRPEPNAAITVYAGGLAAAPIASPAIVATGHADADGHYRVAFLAPGTYTVSASAYDNPFVVTAYVGGVSVAAGSTTTQPLALPTAGSGTAYLHISGPSSIGVGGSITLTAAVVDSSGAAVTDPSVVWTSSDTTVAITRGFGTADSTYGRAPGTATIFASSAGLSDSLTVTVLDSGSVDTVATVAIAPSSADVAVGDSVVLLATPKDAAGNALYGRPVAWFISDTTVAVLYPYGSYALVQPRRTGSAVIQATSDGKSGTATLTVH